MEVIQPSSERSALPLMRFRSSNSKSRRQSLDIAAFKDHTLFLSPTSVLSMMTPGVAFLFRLSPIFAIPLALGFAPSLCARLGATTVPTWAAIMVAITSLPLYALFRVLLRDWRNQRAAAAQGARLVPVVKGRKIGCIDILRQMQFNRKFGYPGASDASHFTCTLV